MTDKVDKETRSAIMSKIRGKDTKPELMVKQLLDSLDAGFAYQPKMKFKPDFAHLEKKILIFVDGSFWHGQLGLPFTSGKFWLDKINNNIARDEAANAYYGQRGWCIIRIWERSLRPFDSQGFKDYVVCLLKQPFLIPGVREYP